MHNAGPLHASYARKITAMKQKRVHKGARIVTAGRMHHKMSRLVDNNNPIVFVHNIQCYVFRLGLERHWIGQAQGYSISGLNPAGRLGSLIVYLYTSISNGLLRARTTDRGNRRGNGNIKALTAERFVN
jgi:hypothetical protein